MPAVTARPRPSGAVHQRGARPPAWSDRPNANLALGTVGPNVATSGEVPADLLQAQAWSGWPDDWRTPYLEAGTPNDWSGFGYGRHDPSGYLQRTSTAMTCVDLNSSQIASFPIYGVGGLLTERLPSWDVNPEPSLYADWSDFMQAAANSLQLDGEACLWATGRFANGYPARFVALPVRRMEIEWVEGRRRFALDGVELNPADVLHIRYQVLPDRARGFGPLEWIYRHLVSASALEAYATDIATHGVPAILSNPANLNTTQRNDAKRNWMEARADRPGAPAVLSGQWSYESISLSPKDMALLDLRILDDQRIAAAFRVPPYLVGVAQPGGGLTYTNVTQLTDHHWRVGLRTLAKKVATAISYWALPGDHRMEFDRDEYTRPPFGERVQGYSVLHGIQDDDGSRAMTVDEIRLAERLLTARDDVEAGNPEASSLVGANP